MAVIYLFDAAKQLKRTIRSVQEVIHKEGEYTAIAQMRANESPEYGDFFGFKCVDGRFRMFLITIMDKADETGICTLTGTDAALAELEGKVLTNLPLGETTAQEAAAAALSGTGWEVGQTTGDGEVATEDAYYSTVWEALKTIAAAGKVRIVPYFEFADGEITGRKVDMLDKTPVYRGLIHTRKKGARNIYITKEGSPKGRVYGLGKIIGTGNPPEQVTFADVVWSKANGDPEDKPAGQDWVAIDGAISADGYVYTDNRETDPQKLLEKAYEDLKKKQKPKASGTANIADMEFKAGYGHRVVRMWDLAVVRTEDGETAEATVINIERYYVQKQLTKVTIGEESETNAARLEEQIASLNSLSGLTAKRVGGVGNAAAQNKQLILNAEELIQLNSKRIELNAEEILLRATKTEVVELEEETAVLLNEVYIDLDAAKAQIELKASQTAVDNLGNEVDNMQATLTIQAKQISSKVEKNGVISAINQTAEEVKIAAARINLEGYVTASELQATEALITNLTSGLTAATVLETNLLNANQANISYLSASALNIADITMQIRTVSMGEVMSHRFLVESTTSDISLQHSHAVSVDETTGLVTLGEVSETGGNFNIADTTFYKNGVSAAAAKVTLSTDGWINGTNTVEASNGKTLTVELPEFSTSGGTAWTSDHKTTVYFSTPSVSVPLASMVVDATSVYEAGADSAGGYDEGYGEGYNAGYAAGKTAYNPTTINRTAYSTTNKTVTVKAANANQDLLTGIVINASEIYDAGYNAGLSAGYDNGYSQGYQAAMNDCTVHYSNFTITNTAANTFYGRVTISAKIDGSTVATGTATKTQTINVGQ